MPFWESGVPYQKNTTTNLLRKGGLRFAVCPDNEGILQSSPMGFLIPKNFRGLPVIPQLYRKPLITYDFCKSSIPSLELNIFAPWK